MAKGINTYTIAMSGNKVCKKCDKNGNVFVKNNYADRWSRRTNYNSKGEAGWYCKCKRCGGTKNIGKASERSSLLITVCVYEKWHL